MAWVFDTDGRDSKGRPQWMVYDENEPETAPVIARAIRSEDLARVLGAVPGMHAALLAVKASWHATDGSDRHAFQRLKEVLAIAGECPLEEVQRTRGESK